MPTPPGSADVRASDGAFVITRQGKLSLSGNCCCGTIPAPGSELEVTIDATDLVFCPGCYYNWNWQYGSRYRRLIHLIGIHGTFTLPLEELTSSTARYVLELPFPDHKAVWNNAGGEDGCDDGVPFDAIITVRVTVSVTTGCVIRCWINANNSGSGGGSTLFFYDGCGIKQGRPIASRLRCGEYYPDTSGGVGDPQLADGLLLSAEVV